MDEYFKEREIRKVIPSKVEAKQALKRLANKSDTKSSSFFIVPDDFVKAESKENDWNESAVKKFVTFKNHLLAFDASLTLKPDR